MLAGKAIAVLGDTCMWLGSGRLMTVQMVGDIALLE